jgi:hypothetical protein
MLRIFSMRVAAVATGISLLVGGCATRPNVSATLAPLPETVTSFGAVTSDGWLYAFGGHKGKRHDYNVEMVSGSFHRLRLRDGQTWETLPSSSAGQGLALVAYKNSRYRIGGMAARNHQGQKQDLYSLPVVQRYDTRTRLWEDVAPLPEPRSSHDAAVIGNKLYVAGGWDLVGGTNKPLWFSNALVLDLDHPQSGWNKFSQPFQRRALATAALGTRLYCIGGMDSDNEPTLSVDVYDTATGTWSKGPDLPKDGGKIKGFACSAIAQYGHIYVTAMKGDLLRLSADGHAWEAVGKLEHPRIAHRLVTAGKTQLIALGGEDGEEDKLPGLELLTPAEKPLTVEKTVSAASQTVTAVHP